MTRHVNDRRRLTARERAEAWFTSKVASVETLTKLLEAHAAATLARHRAKARRNREPIRMGDLARRVEPTWSKVFGK